MFTPWFCVISREQKRGPLSFKRVYCGTRKDNYSFIIWQILNRLFIKYGLLLKANQFYLFLENTILAKKYLKKIQGKDIIKLFIGWICDRDSFFAYLYKFMKKEARDSGSTKPASKIACAGFPISLPEINN